MGDHTESIQIDFDPKKTTYRALLKIFWGSHNVTSHAWGRQYMSAIWYADGQQKQDIQKSMAKYQKKISRGGGGKIQTTIEKLGPFTVAEDYHQKWYLRKHDILLNALQLSEAELRESPVATRLNGYVAGKGSYDQLMAEIDSFALSEEPKGYVANLVKNRKGKGFFCSG